MPISERQAMREHLMILGFVWLGPSLAIVPTTAQGQTAPARSDKDTSGYKRDDRKTAAGV